MRDSRTTPHVFKMLMELGEEFEECLPVPRELLVGGVGTRETQQVLDLLPGERLKEQRGLELHSLIIEVPPPRCVHPGFGLDLTIDSNEPGDDSPTGLPMLPKEGLDGVEGWIGMHTLPKVGFQPFDARLIRSKARPALERGHAQSCIDA